MKKQIFVLSLLMFASVLGVNAQSNMAEQAKKDLVETSKFGGFVIGRAAVNDRDLSSSNKSHSNFDLRLVRAYVDGKVLDFSYKLQLEYEGYGTAKEKGPHIVDAWGEWQKYKFFRVKVGQFKRCFTFENPVNPWDISWGGYSQLADKLAGMNDRLGAEHSSGGRDGGIQFQGDLLPSKKDGHAFVHYQVGLYNGQGINHNDENNHKDIIGNIAINPIKDLSIAFFGWAGNYTSNNITVDRNRYAVGLNYKGQAFKVRAEYGVSEGHKISDYVSPGVLKPGTDDGADAGYATVIVPINKKKNWMVQAKYDFYREGKEWSNAKTIYGLGSEYYFTKNFKLQGNYYFTNDKSTTLDRHHNAFDLQLYWRW